jgi:predicted phage-related endonuclease
MDKMIREQREITSIGDWLKWRRQHITASRVGALWDAHPYLTRAGLQAELLGLAGEVPNSAMRAGNILEGGFPAAVRHDGKPWHLVKATSYHWLPEHRLGCTPDFWADDDGLLQAKTASPQQWEAWHGHPPLAYTLQTLCELLVTGREWGVLAVMIRSGGYPVHYYDVPRHAAAEQRILDAVAQWWQAFDKGDLAAPVSPQDIEALVDDGTHIDLSGDNELPALLDEREALKATHSDAEKHLKEIDATIKSHLGAARTAWLPGWNLTYATQHRKESVIPAKDIRVLRVKRSRDEADAPEEIDA